MFVGDDAQLCDDQLAELLEALEQLSGSTDQLLQDVQALGGDTHELIRQLDELAGPEPHDRDE